MTQTPPSLIQRLAHRFPRMNESKHRHAIDNVGLMVDFYKSKGTSTKFRQYAITLVYVCSVLKMYRKLTEELELLAEEAKDKSEGEEP